MLLPPRGDGADVYYRVFNTDGSEVEQCGNGARCIARLIATRVGRRQVHMDSLAGRVDAEIDDDGQVSVDMGVPNFDPASLPFEATRQADVYPLRIGERELAIGAVSMGNPHAVIEVPSVEEAAVDTLGPAVENHPRFAQRTNVGFLQILRPNHVRLRVHERGVGETRACGTGACAAVAVGRQRGRLDERVRVDLPAGHYSCVGADRGSIFG